jgi:hypothetical protein
LSDWYVSPTGVVGNTGTEGSPWDLASALTGHSGAIQPGDTVWMLGGSYAQAATFSVTVSGTLGVGEDDPATKVKFRNKPGQLASISTTNAGIEVMTLDCSYLWFWATIGQAEGIEIWRNVTERTNTRGSGLWWRDSPQNGNKAIHVVTRDCGNGVLTTNGAGTAADYGDHELYGLISFNCGQDTSPRTHGVYVQHTSPGGKKFHMIGAIIFNTLGHGAQLYSEIANSMVGYDVDKCIIFNAGVLGTATAAWDNLLFGVSAQAIKQSTLKNVVCFHKGSSTEKKHLVLGTDTTPIGEDCEMSDCYFVGGDGGQGDLLDIRWFRVDTNPSLKFDRNFVSRRAAAPVRLVRNGQTGSLANYTSWTNNVWSGRTAAQLAWRQNVTDTNYATWKTNTGLGASDTQQDADPVVTKTFVFPLTKYNPGYGHVCFVNWGADANVNVDVSSILAVNDTYAIYNVQDIFGAPVLSGTYAGGAIAFPTTGKTPPAPVGTTPRTAGTTAPDFDAFVVVKTGTFTPGGGGGGAELTGPVTRRRYAAA